MRKKTLDFIPWWLALFMGIYQGKKYANDKSKRETSALFGGVLLWFGATEKKKSILYILGHIQLNLSTPGGGATPTQPPPQATAGAIQPVSTADAELITYYQFIATDQKIY